MQNVGVTADPHMMRASAGTEAGTLNRRGLQRDHLRERLQLFGLALPALALVTVIMVAPVAWLFWLSFTADDGTLTLQHYRRLVEQPAYVRTFITTFKVSALTTLICIAQGYPLAYAERLVEHCV